MPAPFEQCPRFFSCSVPLCPLDPDVGKRVKMQGEETCPLGKTRRMRIAAAYPKLLPNRGLFPRELSSLLAWEALPPAERARRVAAMPAIPTRERTEGRLLPAPEDDFEPEGSDSGSEASPPTPEATGETFDG